MSDVEIVAEAAEEVIDGIVDVVEVFRTNPVALAGAGVVGLALGVAGGYFLATKLLEQKYSDIAQQEIAEAKVFYASLNKVDEDGDILTPQQVLAAANAQREYQGDDAEPEDGFPAGEPHDDLVDEAQISKIQQSLRDQKNEDAAEAIADEENNVKTPYRKAFKGGNKEGKSEVNMFADDTFDLEEESKYRTEDKPYIITHDEYFENERDSENWHYTYYEVDGVLTDEQDKPVEDTDELIGDDHLVRFGSGSKDPNVVYIRNERMGVDFEITRSKGSYLEEVLGIPKEDENSLKHSDQRAARKAFRHGDG